MDAIQSDGPIAPSLDDLAPGARKLVLAVEALVAEFGVKGAAVREILRRAGQRNNSAIYHHFGSKAALIECTYDIRQGQVDASRRRKVEQLSVLPTSVEELLCLVLLPVIDTFQGQDRAIFAMFVLHLILADPNSPMFAYARQPPTTRALSAALRQACDHLSDTMFRQRFSLAATYFLQAILYMQNEAGEQGWSDQRVWRDVVARVSATFHAPSD